MYEHLRNDFLSAMVDNEIPENEIHYILLTLDQVASQYEVQRKELMKNYIV